MPVTVTCPECDADVRVRDESEGKKVRCKACDTSFVARFPSEDIDEDDEPEPAPKAKSKKKGVKKLPPKKGNGLLIGLGVGGALVFLLLASVVGYFVLRPGKKVDPGVAQGTAPTQPVPSGTVPPFTPPGGGVPPIGNPAVPNANVVAPVATSVALDFKNGPEMALHSPNVLAVCSQGEGLPYHLHCHAFDPKTGLSLGGFPLKGVQSPTGAALSPDGTRIALLEKPTFKEVVVSVWSVPDGKAVVAQWKPYVFKPAEILKDSLYTVAWTAFLGADRLLTLTQGGRVAVWSLPDGKPVYDVQAATPEAFAQYATDNGTREPVNFALSPDRRVLALHQNGGVTLVDTATGRFQGSLPAPKGLPQFPTLAGMAFSPDAKRLAACYSTAPDRSLAVWDVALARLDVTARLPKNPLGSKTWAWWGDRYLICLNSFDMLVVRAADGVVARQGMLPIHKLVNGGFDGKLRIVGGMLRKHYLVFDSPVGHMANDPVADDGAGSYKRFWLTEAGIEKRPVNEQSSVPKIPLAAR